MKLGKLLLSALVLVAIAGLLVVTTEAKSISVAKDKLYLKRGTRLEKSTGINLGSPSNLSVPYIADAVTGVWEQIAPSQLLLKPEVVFVAKLASRAPPHTADI